MSELFLFFAFDISVELSHERFYLACILLILM